MMTNFAFCSRKFGSSGLCFVVVVYQDLAKRL